jgi:hypothetical protein
MMNLSTKNVDIGGKCSVQNVLRLRSLRMEFVTTTNKTIAAMSVVGSSLKILPATTESVKRLAA